MIPKVSVIMGIYNCADTLSESIDSIIAQTYENWELIMCDDASTDNTYNIALSYIKKFPNKMKLVRNEINQNLAGSLNHCLKYVTGHYVARMDGDDISTPERFQKQIDFLNINSQYQIVGTGMISFDESGIRGITLSEPEPQTVSVVNRTPFCHATIMMRSEIYKELNGYRECRQTRRMEDLDLWIRFFEKGYLGYNLQEPLYMVREDLNAMKRRKLTYSIDAAILILQACLKLRLPWKNYFFVFKPIIVGLMPAFLMNFYHKRRLSKVSNINF